MSDDSFLVRAVRHPLTGLTTVFGVVAHLFSFGPVDAVAATVWGQASTLFTVTSIGAFTFAPNVPSIPVGPLKVAALLVGAIYVAKLGDQLVDAAQKRL